MSRSLWFQTASIPGASPLVADVETEVAVIGAGVAGLNAALRLAESGKRVVILEARAIGLGETGHTTSHLTTAIDGGWIEIRKHFGEDDAKEIARYARRGVDLIMKQIETLQFDANRNSLDAWIVSETGEDLDDLREEADASNAVGISASFEQKTPWKQAHGGIRYPEQGRIQPVAYLQGLREQFETRGGVIYEGARVEEVVDGEPCVIRIAGGRTVHARQVIVAANVPFNDRFTMHTKLWAWRSYAVALRIDPAVMEDALIFDTADPYHYVRLAKWKEGHVVVVGGEDHRTGTDEEPQDRWTALEEWTRQRLTVGERVAEWSGQIIETPDGAPYVGKNPGDQNVWIATGWIGQGMTWGAAGGELIARLILGEEDPLQRIFDPSRMAPVGELTRYVKRNLEFPKHIVTDRIISADIESESLDQVRPGQGKIVARDGEKLAVYRREDGSVICLSPVCPHMKCDVKWNAAEVSWDCPCHGSRFTPEGEVLNGPASVPLTRKDADAKR